jgi:hypothetical protein
VFHFTNDRMFINKGLDKSMWQDKDVWRRSMFMYHGYVNHQTAFMRKQLMIMAKNGDYMGLAQFAGTMAVIFPFAATLIAGLEKLATTGSPAQAMNETSTRFSRLVHPQGVEDWLGNYITLLAHCGAVGTYITYLNAIKGHRIAEAMIGPAAGAIANDTYDIYTAAHEKKDETHNLAPLGRDLLKQTLPVIGSPLAHQLLPTKKEEVGDFSNDDTTSTSKSRFHKFGRRRR